MAKAKSGTRLPNEATLLDTDTDSRQQVENSHHSHHQSPHKKLPEIQFIIPTEVKGKYSVVGLYGDFETTTTLEIFFQSKRKNIFCTI